MKVITEKPSLSWIQLYQIAWDPAPDGSLPISSMSISRCKWVCREYYMEGCTDDSMALWLSALVLPNSMCRLRQQDEYALCHIGSALVEHIDAAERSSHACSSRRATKGISKFMIVKFSLNLIF